MSAPSVLTTVGVRVVAITKVSDAGRVRTHSEILPTIGFQNGEKMKNAFLKVLRGPKCL